VQPWRTLDEASTSDGKLALRRRGERDFLLTIDGRVLMSSMLHRSEDALAKLAIERIADRPRPRVLTAGLGLGFTLRALLDVLGRGARVEVAELHEPIVRWCRGPLAAINRGAASDARVHVTLGDVMALVHEGSDPSRRYDAVVLDLLEGPNRGRAHALRHLYGARALAAVRDALSPGGVYAVWGEEADPRFVELLRRAGFDARKVVVGSGGPKHVVYVAQPGSGRELPHGAAPPHGPAPAASGRPRR
jgi:spermidine synthase